MFIRYSLLLTTIMSLFRDTDIEWDTIHFLLFAHNSHFFSLLTSNFSNVVLPYHISPFSCNRLLSLTRYRTTAAEANKHSTKKEHYRIEWLWPWTSTTRVYFSTSADIQTVIGTETPNRQQHRYSQYWSFLYNCSRRNWVKLALFELPVQIGLLYSAWWRVWIIGDTNTSRRNWSERRKPRRSASVSIEYPKWNSLELNPGFSKKPVINYLS
jgi:hypothetical protein